ncbi:MAG: MSMEG_4193 family putative phosphomutase [Anaerolineae bacterium]|nr:MSMEG_4193 family putative phosphomutase [Anaerolineae bacterium]
MTQILLIRHAVNEYVKTGKLAGRIEGVHLNDDGQEQAEALGKRLADVPLRYIYVSRMERTMETARAIHQHHANIPLEQHDGILEVDYGDWQDMKISELTKRKMWSVIQEYPTRAYFPNGETMRSVQNRVVDTIEALVEKHGNEMIALVFHADLIKMAVAHYLGVHLDNFQRIVISPASISTLILGHSRPYVANVNDTAHLQEVERRKRKQEEMKNAKH